MIIVSIIRTVVDSGSTHYHPTPCIGVLKRSAEINFRSTAESSTTKTLVTARLQSLAGSNPAKPNFQVYSDKTLYCIGNFGLWWKRSNDPKLRNLENKLALADHLPMESSIQALPVTGWM